MIRPSALALLSLFSASVRGGTTLWSGSFDAYPTVADFDLWTWSNLVGEYQWYIHGTQPTSHYLALDPSYKNPADSEINGLRVTIDSGAVWNSQMERTELIPQTTANLGTGNLFYHFSISIDDVNPPESTLEHQILFFESHFTELKYGVGPNATNLEWHVASQPQWGVPWEAGVWHNFAYDIDFSAGSVGLWHSEGSSPLTKVMQNVKVATSTNSADFHVGVLRIVNDAHAETYYLSGVYIESGPITTTIGSGTGGSSAPPGSSSSKPASPTSAPPTTSKPPTTTSTASGPAQTKYGQCGGTGYTGPTACVSGTTCVAVSPPFYYQCQ